MMKILLCLMATVAACSAGLLGGGNSVSQVQVQPQTLQQVHAVAAAPQQQVKIIKIQNVGSAGGYAGGHGGGYSYGSGGAGYGGGSYAQPQIIKVIHEQAPIGGGYATQGYSNGHGQSYASGYSSYQTSLESILPQILKIVFEDADSAGDYQQGSAYAGQLIDVYGTSGHAVITRGGNSADYLRGGRVVEKGHLEVVKVDRQNTQGGSYGGGYGGSNGGGLGGGIAGGLGSGLSNLFSGKW